MVVDDIPNVYLIERHAHAFPWSEGILRDCLRVNYQCLVLESARHTMLGFSVAQIVVQECHIMNICIDPNYQRKGLGRVLLRELLSDAKQKGAERAYLEVRSSNHPACQLYQNFGFGEIGRRKGYYPAKGRREDAIILTLDL